MADQAIPGCSDTDRIRVSSTGADYPNMVVYVGQEEGLYDDACLNVETVQTRSAPDALKLAISGDLELARTSPDNMLVLLDQGVDVQAATVTETGFFQTLVLAGEGSEAEDLSSLADELRGAKMGVLGLGGTQEALAHQALEATGLSVGDVELVALGGLAEQVAALSNDSVQALFMFGTQAEVIEGLGAGHIAADFRRQPGLMPTAAAALDGLSLVWAGTSNWLAENPEVAERFSETEAEVIEWIQDPQNRPRLTEIMFDRVETLDQLPESDRDTVNEEATNLYADTLIGNDINMDALTAWQDLALTNGMIDNPVNTDDFFWQAPE